MALTHVVRRGLAASVHANWRRGDGGGGSAAKQSQWQLRGVPTSFAQFTVVLLFGYTTLAFALG